VTTAAEREALAVRRAHYENAKGHAHETVQWGPYEVLIFRRAAYTAEVHQPGSSRRRKKRIPASWYAVAYDGDRRAYGRRELQHPTKAKALAALRSDMVRALDRLPNRIEFLEAELVRLRTALYEPKKGT
jgi:hypothetical protein